MQVLGPDPGDPDATAPAAASSSSYAREEQQHHHVVETKSQDNVIEIDSSVSSVEKRNDHAEGSGERSDRTGDAPASVEAGAVPDTSVGPVTGISRQTSVDVPEEMITNLAVNPLLSVKGQCVS